MDEQQRETKLYARRGVLMPVLSEWEEDAERTIFYAALFIVTIFTFWLIVRLCNLLANP